MTTSYAAAYFSLFSSIFSEKTLKCLHVPLPSTTILPVLSFRLMYSYELEKKSQPLTHLSYYNKSNSWCRGQNRILLYGVFRTRRILQQPDSHLEDSESTISRCKNKRKKITTFTFYLQVQSLKIPQT